jgi:hypothetical protein
MGVQNPPSAVIFGANNFATNLETGELTSNGTLSSYNGSKNYISYNNFENNATTGWSLGTTGTLTNAIPTGVPTFGSGTTNLAISVVNSGQIEGTYSLSLVASAATTAGNMLATQAYTIDTEDQAKVLTFKFYYSVPSGVANCNFSGTSSNSFGVAVWDSTNSSWLTSTANFGMTQSSGVGFVTGTCQTNATTASLRFVIYAANATAGAATLNFDGFYLGPQTAPIGAPITDWVAYTPTIVGYGTVTSSSFFSRRVGGDLEVTGTYTLGTTTAVTVQIPIGFNGASANVTVDTSRIPPSSVCGYMLHSVANATTFSGAVLVPAANQTYVNLGYQTSTQSSETALTGTIFATGATQRVQFSVPIVGWSSNVQMSNDTDTRVVSAYALAGTPNSTPTSSFAKITWSATPIAQDTHGGWSAVNNNYVIPITGYYNFSLNIENASTSGTLGNNLFARINNTTQSKTIIGTGGSFTTSGSTALAYASGILLCNAGDVIEFDVKNSNAGTLTWANADSGTYFSISRLSGPSVIAATESVNMSYNTSATSLSGSLATVTYSNKIRDSHNQYASGSYTIPVTGTYSAAAAIAVSGTIALNNTLDLQIQQTGSATQIAEQKVYSGGTETALSALAFDLFYCLAGDVLKVQVSSSVTGPTIVSSASQNYFSITRVGN